MILYFFLCIFIISNNNKQMKRELFFLFFIMNVFVANAQWSVAPEVGLSAFNHNNIGDGWRPAVKIGAAIEYAFKPNYSIESGLYYTQRGYSMAGKISIPDDWNFNEAPSLVRHLFQLPIRARSSCKVADDTRFFVGAGPYVGIYFANDWKQTYLLKDAHTGNTFDWGFTAMAGIEIKHWFYRIGYDISLGNEFGNGVSAKYHVGTISVGYKF